MIKSKIGELINKEVISISTLGGGCIGNSFQCNTKNGETYFAKEYSSGNSLMAKCEYNGLLELHNAAEIKIPEIINFTNDIIVLEFIQQGKPKENFYEHFGRQFAALHKHSSTQFGFKEDNFIGSNLQKNTPPSTSWADFYISNRLNFQFKLAEKNNFTNSSFNNIYSQFVDKLPSIIAGTEEKPSLLHGDLWGGNYLVDKEGNPCLIDPAVYYGHREADLAMTMLFGGFDTNFYNSYNECYPFLNEFYERVEIYKLYHVLNHLNLFGSSYYSQAIKIMQKFI